jgi:hypothetical protein
MRCCAAPFPPVALDSINRVLGKHRVNPQRSTGLAVP